MNYGTLLQACKVHFMHNNTDGTVRHATPEVEHTTKAEGEHTVYFSKYVKAKIISNRLHHFTCHTTSKITENTVENNKIRKFQLPAMSVSFPLINNILNTNI